VLAEAELEGQLAAERANQERMLGKDAGANFIKILQQQMREAVVAAIVQAMVDTAGIQDKIAPFLTVVREQAQRITEHPEEAGDAKSVIEAAWQDVKATIAENTAVMDLLAPYLTQLQFAHGGGVPGRAGRAVPIVAHAGEYVLSVEQLDSLQSVLTTLTQGPGVGGRNLGELHFHFEGDGWANPEAITNVHRLAEAMVEELKMQGILDTA
jgi:hypothetical protein